MPSEDRGLAAALAKIATHPSALVLAALAGGALRMTELTAGVPTIDEGTLSDALRELDSAGLVARRVDPGPPLRVLYELTERGSKIAPALAILTTWDRSAR
jgi:DNA-binding HxlR family transcriptional regulator